MTRVAMSAGADFASASVVTRIPSSGRLIARANITGVSGARIVSAMSRAAPSCQGLADEIGL